MENLEVNGETVTVVGDSATVHQLIGHQSNTFNYNEDSPTELFAAAREYLGINAPRRATDLIECAMTRGLNSSEVAYYWQLALLADRPFGHLSQIEHNKIIEAHGRAKNYAADEWTAATEVVVDLLHCYTSRLSEEGFDEDLFDRSMKSFDALPPARREEMVRHVSSLLEGAKSDRLDQEQRNQIRLHRMAEDRLRRVPLFFDPDPARPRPRPTAPPAVSAATWVAFVLGTGSCGWALYMLGRKAVREDSLTGGFTVAWVLVSCLALAVHGTRYLDGLGQLKRYRASVNRALAVKRPALDRAIARRFAVLGNVKDLGDDLRAERALLAQSLSDAYPDPTAPELDWLIRWHADRARSGRPTADIPAVAGRGEALASAASLALAVLTEVVQIADWTLEATFTLLGSGVLFGFGNVLLRTGITVFTEPRRYEAETQRNERLLEEEEAVWGAEKRRLEDRPGDSQMAKWLDFDTLQIRLAAMKQWGLSNDDVLAHVVLTEPDSDSRTARATGCPRRYARYLIRLFLLTANGVRQLDVKLDFASGAENDERRRAFKYDAIASAVIAEPTVRRFGRRQVAAPDGGGPDGQVRPIRRQSLTLTLVNGEEYAINADYESGLADENALDPESLTALEMETSGAVSTLRTLESVAGEGREWIARERERLRAAARDYRRASA
jgi:hypothetical protein